METDRKWIVVRVDGKLAGISCDYDRLAEIAARISQESGTAGSGKTGRRTRAEQRKGVPYGEVSAKAVSFEEVWMLRETTRWEDLMLFGTDFQKQVWKKLWELTHRNEGPCEENRSSDKSQTDLEKRKLLSYSDFAELCKNRSGVRAVAHAIGLNPVPVVIPCHLVVPKEAMDRIRDIMKHAESTIFKGEDICLDSVLNAKGIDFGEYALGKEMKRELISKDLI